MVLKSYRVLVPVIVGGSDDSGYKWHATRAVLFTTYGTADPLQIHR